MVVAQRLCAVDIVQPGSGHVFAETLLVGVAVGIALEERLVELEFHAQAVGLDVGEELRQRFLSLPEVVGCI